MLVNKLLRGKSVLLLLPLLGGSLSIKEIPFPRPIVSFMKDNESRILLL
ncbi:hypothetical protein J2Z65_004259 [Paenibacillus aceris]|uniref:Uncharacterized protein n=1 Tax=Paenibacillus aceris TaxID=869555 RepID=A0ABS4I291_9BACL|nr:hypothetical protein [Paenibacillus aceris]